MPNDRLPPDWFEIIGPTRAKAIRAVGSNRILALRHPDDAWWQGYKAACEDNQAAIFDGGQPWLETGE